MRTVKRKSGKGAAQNGEDEGRSPFSSNGGGGVEALRERSLG